MVARLYQRPDAEMVPYTDNDLAGLPDPVVRYFRFALTAGQRRVSRARFDQTGEFAMRPGSWKPFTAVESFSVDRPGFLWDARIRIAGMTAMYVRDGYLAGEGAMLGTLGAIVPVVNQSGTSQMAAGELVRYLAELVLLPTALLPGGGVSWKPLDDKGAEVTLVDGQTTVSCTVDFAERGEIVRMSAMRHMANDDAPLTRWVGHFRDYDRVDGMMIPTSAEVAWMLPAGPFPYWRGRMRNVRYDFAPPVA